MTTTNNTTNNAPVYADQFTGIAEGLSLIVRIGGRSTVAPVERISPTRFYVAGRPFVRKNEQSPQATFSGYGHDGSARYATEARLRFLEQEREAREAREAQNKAHREWEASEEGQRRDAIRRDFAETRIEVVTRKTSNGRYDEVCLVANVPTRDRNSGEVTYPTDALVRISVSQDARWSFDSKEATYTAPTVSFGGYGAMTIAASRRLMEAYQMALGLAAELDRQTGQPCEY